MNGGHPTLADIEDVLVGPLRSIATAYWGALAVRLDFQQPFNPSSPAACLQAGRLQIVHDLDRHLAGLLRGLDELRRIEDRVQMASVSDTEPPPTGYNRSRDLPF